MVDTVRVRAPRVPAQRALLSAVPARSAAGSAGGGRGHPPVRGHTQQERPGNGEQLPSHIMHARLKPGLMACANCLQMPAHSLWPRQPTSAALPEVSCLHASGLYVRQGEGSLRQYASQSLALIGKSKGCSSETSFMRLPARLRLSHAACSLAFPCTLTPGSAVPGGAATCGILKLALPNGRSSKSAVQYKSMGMSSHYLVFEDVWA